MKKISCNKTLTAIILLLTFSVTVIAQNYPSKPVKIVVPFASGGPADNYARFMSQKLQDELQQTFVVENKPGAGSVIGTDIAAKAPADGYTIMLATPDLTINPSLQSKLPYDTKKAFAPISIVGTYPMLLVVNEGHKINSVMDLKSQAQMKPGQMNYASAGNGSLPHLCGELLNSMAKINLTHVPYKGNGPAIIDLLAGHVSVLFTGGPAVSQFVKAGKLKVLGVSTLERHPTLPDIPTLNESGIPGYDVTAWFGFIAPVGVPKEVIARLNTDIGQALQDPEVRAKLAGLGADLGGGTPEAFGALLNSEIDKWGRVIRVANIKPD